MKNLRLTSELVLRWTGILLVALIITLLVKDQQRGFWPDFVVSLCFVGTMWNIDYQVMRYFQKRYLDVRQTAKRLLYTVVALLTVTFIVHYNLCWILGLFGLIEDPSIAHSNMYLPTSLIATTMVGTLYESVYFFGQWRRTVLEAEQLRTQQLRSELEVLKTQISPHFLFNSLNTLVTLIEENPKQAVSFTQKLSEVYRFILTNKEEEMVTLEREMKFTESYIFLLKMRFAENLHIRYDIPAEHMSSYLPPMTLQILIENAIKHNVVSVAKPLHIDIVVKNGDTLLVRNNYQPKSTAVASTHTGLKNIRRRYQYLSQREVEVTHSLSHFEVAMPLVQVQNYAMSAV